MSNFKRSLAVVFAGAVVLFSTFASSCAAMSNNHKASGLPSLLAFSSDRGKTVHVYTINPDGSDTRTTSDDALTHDGMSSWSPDGTRIAFSSNQSEFYEIWTMNADGSDRQQLTSQRGTSTSPKYSPDGRKIVFVNKRRDANLDYHTDIFVINNDGTNVHQLTVAPANAHTTTDDEAAMIPEKSPGMLSLRGRPTAPRSFSARKTIATELCLSYTRLTPMAQTAKSSVSFSRLKAPIRIGRLLPTR